MICNEAHSLIFPQGIQAAIREGVNRRQKEVQWPLTFFFF
jgi:hypothetical protein